MNTLCHIKHILIFLGCLLLAACVTQQAKQLTAQSVSTFLHTPWQEQGMLSYREGKKGFSAAYVWQNASNQYTIQVIAPLGAWRAKLNVAGSSATLSTSDGKVLQAKDPLALMEENLDWSIPVTYLRYWLWGVPAPDAPFTAQNNTQHDVTHLTQAGWSIDYLSYQNFSLARLPTKIVLMQDEKKITLVIENFQAKHNT